MKQNIGSMLLKKYLYLLPLFISLHANGQAPWYQKEVRTEAHDPTVIRDNRGMYTMMSTNNLLTIRQSDNGTTWTNRGRIFSSMPSWIATSLGAQIENIWAPHITFRNGRYWVYYCASSFGTNNSVIGVASNPTLDVTSAQYAWTDHGEVIKTTNSNNYNAIDPELFVDKNGRVWMSFGSWWTGIKMVEVDPATGKRLASNSTVYSLANRGGSGIEGPSIIEHNGYYYLFTAWDVCCQGTASTYRTMVGRSTSITGPYVDKQGRNLNNNYGEQVLGSYGRYIGQGGGSAFYDGKRSYFTHHYYNAEENGGARIQIREIVWGDDNWPVVTQPFLGRRASYEAEHAVVVNSPISKSVNNSSNDEYISMTNGDSRATFHLNVLAAGNYRLRIRYASTAAATHFVKVNTNAEETLQYPATASSTTFPQAQAIFYNVTLKKGANVIVLRKGTNSVLLDRIDLVRFANQDLLSGSYEDSRSTSYILPDSQNVRMLPNGWLLFENVDFGTGDNTNINFTFSGTSSGTMEVRADALTGSVMQSYTISNSQLSQNFSVSSGLSTLQGIHDVYVINKNTSGDFLLKSIKFSVAANQAPTISITAPANNANFTAPASITINATAADADGTVGNVQFYNGATLLGSDASFPYSFNWTNVAAGTYQLTAKATDNAGSITISTVITVVVNAPGNLPPIVSITAPVNNATYTAPASITITTTASDPDGNVTNLQLFNGSTLLASTPANPGNPIIKHKFTADPCALVSNNTVYLYTGHDEASTTDTDYRMDNWHVFSSTDMVNWTDHGQKLSVSSFSWAQSHAFAGHVVERNGKFYWYVPMIVRGSFFGIGVAVSDSPTGPFVDALGKPLITNEMTPDLSYDIDPAVFIDDDGQAYMYWGNVIDNSPCKMVKLKANMTEIDGAITTVNIPYFTEAPYVHKKNGIYYLSYASGWPEAIIYATSNSPLGPWTHRGTLNDVVSSATNHQSIIEFQGQPYFFYHTADLPGGGDYRRSVCIDKLYYNTDGTIKKIIQTKGTAAVSPYSFNWNNVPAGTYTLTAKATDNSGAVTTSAPITVIVNPVVPVGLTLQAETACTAAGVLSETTNAGYNGNGYLNLNNAVGSSATWVINSTVNQSVSLTVRYANGSANNRNMSLMVNGASQLANIDFLTTSAWATWNTVTVQVTLVAGRNVLELTSLTAEGAPNIDQLSFGVTSVSVASCTPPNQFPTITITSPANNATFTAPASITINATAADADGTVSNVEFYNGTTLLGSDATSPYSFNWTNVAAGTYILTAKATDNSGAVTTSSAITVVVNPGNQFPTVSITSPANNATFTAPASITINATAADADGTVSSVEFYNGTTLLGSDATSPYSFSWTNVVAGTYILTAKATDNSGAVTTSSATTIAVNPANQFPTVIITSPVNNATFTAPASIMINATAADADGTLSNVEFYIGTTLLGSDATAPYSFNWTNVAAGMYALTARATDNSGAVSTSPAITVTVSNPPAGFTLQAETACTSAGVLSETTNTGYNGNGYLNLNNAVGSSATWSINSTINQTVSLSIRYANGSANNRNMSLMVNGATQLANVDFLTTSAWTTWNTVSVQVTLVAGRNVLELTSLTAEGAPNMDELTFSGTSVSSASCTPPNQIPTLSITSPANNATFTAPASFTITASATDADGTVSLVEFYNGAVLLGSDAAAPYSFDMVNLIAGTYTLTVKATDNSGAATTSSISVTINDVSTGLLFSNKNVKFIEAYPNPSLDIFMIRSDVEIKSARLMDIHGVEAEVISTINAGKLTELGRNIGDGVYILMVEYASGETEAIRLIKLK